MHPIVIEEQQILRFKKMFAIDENQEEMKKKRENRKFLLEQLGEI